MHHTKYVPDGIPRCKRDADAKVKFKPLEFITLPKNTEPKDLPEKDNPEVESNLPKSLIKQLQEDFNELHRTRLSQEDRVLMARRSQGQYSREAIADSLDDMANREVRETLGRINEEIARCDELRVELDHTKKRIQEAQLPKINESRNIF